MEDNVKLDLWPRQLMPSQSTERKKSWHSQTCLVYDRCCALVNSFLNRAIVTTCPGLLSESHFSLGTLLNLLKAIKNKFNLLLFKYIIFRKKSISLVSPQKKLFILHIIAVKQGFPYETQVYLNLSTYETVSERQSEILVDVHSHHVNDELT